MTKELSIENIKKELIDKISNNEEVLEIFENYCREHGASSSMREYGTKGIKDNFIFDHYVFDNHTDFISVEVDKTEYTAYGNNEKKLKARYAVSIMMSLTNTSELDRLSMLIEAIVTELYPNRCNYSNRGLTVDLTGYCGKYSHPLRTIVFALE